MKKFTWNHFPEFSIGLYLKTGVFFYPEFETSVIPLNPHVKLEADLSIFSENIYPVYNDLKKTNINVFVWANVL
jgi:hypothetical protein